MKNFKKGSGFTLIEVLIVIGIIAVLASIVIVAINPARQFAQARNTERESNVSTILNALGQDLADNEGVFGGVCASTTIPTVPTHIGTANGLLDLSCLVPIYIPTALPQDPTGGTVADTGYTVAVDANGRYTVCAPNANEAALGNPGPICLTR